MSPSNPHRFKIDKILDALRGIESIDSVTDTRNALIKWRNKTLSPSAFDPGMAVLLSHTIAHLARLERVEEVMKKP